MSGQTPGVYINSSGKKTFIPLENNPTVFTALVHRLGLSTQLEFHDVWSIDEPALLATISRPVHALVFISPADIYHRVRVSDPGQKPLFYTGHGPGEPVVWFKQTIGHACGLIALLHSVANGSARDFVVPDSLLQRLLDEAEPLEPLPRAQVLYDSAELEQAHMACAVQGDTQPPSSEEPNGYHFISFVKGSNGHLYELEGSWGGPIDRGELAEGEDMLSPRALELGVRRHLEQAQGSVEFSMIALSTKPS